MQEYYIRNPDVDESRGPFTLEQLSSLAETGNITLETLVYDPAVEAWEVLEHHDGLRKQIFPEKKRLTFKEKADYESLNKGEDLLPAITIDMLLAAAEGTTEETKHKKKASIWKEKAAVLAMHLSATAFLLGAIGLFWFQRAPLLSFDIGAILRSPLILFAILDLGLALILFLQTTAVYPLVRFRTMLGAGFLLFYFWAAGVPLAGVAAASAGVGIFGLTLFLQVAPFVTFAALALLGSLGMLVLAFIS